MKNKRIENSPLVSIIMPVYNGEKYLTEAIDSILNQTYKNIEFIIVNDGSKDNSDQIIRSYNDPRINYIVHKKNVGLDTTLNESFKKATGVYVARMDCDDISYSTRIEKQVAFMETNPTYGMCGTQYVHLNQQRKPVEIGAQLFDDNEIKLAIQSLNSFCHGAVMFRNSFLKTHNIEYLNKYSPYEDYELWTRISQMTKVHNLSEVLYAYMDNPSGMYLTQYKEMIEGPLALGKKLQKTMFLPPFTFSFIRKLYAGSKKYRLKTITIDGVVLPSNFMLAYQTFLYKLGRVYISRNQPQGIILFVMSFFLNPANWTSEIRKKVLHI